MGRALNVCRTFEGCGWSQSTEGLKVVGWVGGVSETTIKKFKPAKRVRALPCFMVEKDSSKRDEVLTRPVLSRQPQGPTPCPSSATCHGVSVARERNRA